MLLPRQQWIRNGGAVTTYGYWFRNWVNFVEFDFDTDGRVIGISYYEQVD